MIAFDLITQYSFDVFSHKKFIQSQGVTLTYNDLLLVEKVGDPAIVQVFLKTNTVDTYIIELDGDNEVITFVEDVCTNTPLDIKTIDGNIYFKAISGQTVVGFLMNVNSFTISKFNISRLDCVDLFSCTYTDVCTVDHKKLEPFPKCETHGRKCPSCN
jgi:hypothetical protein